MNKPQLVPSLYRRKSRDRFRIVDSLLKDANKDLVLIGLSRDVIMQQLTSFRYLIKYCRKSS